MKFIHVLILLLVALIKFVESCMRLTNCEWKDPCNKYTTVQECYEHKECTLGQPEDSGVEVHFEYGDADDLGGNMDNANPGIPPPLFCVKKDFKQCYIRMQCAIF
jgi:hypothetical protein